MAKVDDNVMSVEYLSWIAELKRRYRATQIKAAVSVNSALIGFYWDLGRDIHEKYPGEEYGSKFFVRLSGDLRREMPNAGGFTKVNLIYCLKFFKLYNGEKIVPQLVEQLVLVPWGHHRYIIDKCGGDREKALFYVRRTIQNGWSRAVLLNQLSTDLYAREGRAQTNFALTMPSDDCDLAQQLVKDPQYVPLPADLGQLLDYKVIVEHTLNTPVEGEPIGLVVCKDHNRILAQYMMDELKTPLGITDYELKRILPPPEEIQTAIASVDIKPTLNP